MYTHELKQEITRVLSAIPAVQQVNHLQYWGEQDLFVVTLPDAPGVAAAVDAALEGVVAAWRGLQPARLRWRVLAPGEAVPASAVLFQRAA